MMGTGRARVNAPGNGATAAANHRGRGRGAADVRRSEHNLSSSGRLVAPCEVKAVSKALVNRGPG